MSPSLSTPPLIPRKPPTLSVSTTTKQKAHEVEVSCAFAEYDQLRNAGGETRTHKWGFTHRRFLRPLSLPISAHPQKSVKYYGTDPFYSPLLPMATIKSHQTRCGGISQRKKHLLEQNVSCSVYISVVSTSTMFAHDRQPLVIRHFGV